MKHVIRDKVICILIEKKIQSNALQKFNLVENQQSGEVMYTF